MLNCTFKQLRAFLAVAEEGTFGLAAERLEISQPAVSAHVRALEQQTGALFIRRRGARVSLSEAGQKLYQRLPELLGDWKEIGRDILDDTAAGQSLRIGAAPYLADHIRMHIADFALLHPECAIDLSIISTEPQGLEELRRRHIDLLYMTRADEQFPPGCELLREVSAAIFGTPSMIAAGLARQPPRVPLILPNAGTPEEAFVLDRLASAKLRYEIAGRAQHLLTARDMALRALGCCLTYGDLVAGDVKSGALERWPDFEWTLYRCWYRNGSVPVSTPAAAFHDYIRARL